MAQAPHAPPSPYHLGPEPGAPSGFTQRKAMIVLLIAACAFGAVASCFALGNSLLVDEVCTLLREQAVVSEELGDNIECSLDWAATSNDERMDFFHYEVEGSKGTGVAIVHTESTGADGHEQLVEGVLEVRGSSFELE